MNSVKCTQIRIYNYNHPCRKALLSYQYQLTSGSLNFCNRDKSWSKFSIEPTGKTTNCNIGAIYLVCKCFSFSSLITNTAISASYYVWLLGLDLFLQSTYIFFWFSLASAFWCSYTKSIHPSTQTTIHTHRKYSETQITPTLQKAQPHLATFIIFW
jgi:hypothetical protein